MGETTDQIENYIENKRDDLGSNLHELETKINSMTDWKHYFQKSPMTMMGLAFGGGIVLAAMMGGKNRRRVSLNGERQITQPANPQVSRLRGAALETWDHVKGALIGVAATRAKDFIEEVVPGFREQFERAQTR